MATPPKATPRISVNDLALYMVSSETTKLAIIKRSKYPQKSPILRYKDVRQPICAHLSDLSRSLDPLVAAEAMFNQRRQDMSVSPLSRDDAEHSINVLHAIQTMANKLKAYDFQKAPMQQKKLLISGVQVSVHADLLVHGTRKGVEEIGAAVLRMTQDDAETDAARAKRKEMGLLVATLARLHVERNFSTNRKPANRLCMSIDVQHGELFIAPDSNSQRIKNIESACQFIAMAWPSM